MKASILTSFLLALSSSFTDANQVKRVHRAAGDASIRRDRKYQNYGSNRQLTVTTHDAKSARVAVLQFNNIERTSYDTQALLRLFISEVDDNHDHRTVKIRRVNEDFEEDDVSWANFNFHEENHNWIEFNIHSEHLGKVGQVDVSTLLEEGDTDLTLVIHMSDKGYVKFASREHETESTHPKILLLE